MVRAWSHDRTTFPLPAGHRFPLAKYRALRAELEGELDVHDAAPASWAALGAVHDHEYVARVREGRLSTREVRALGLPWSPELVERGRRSTQATVEAARDALDTGYGLNLGGGTHHAGRASGRGFCLFNDTAVALAALPEVRHLLVVDTDVHQGDGTAELLTGHPRATTLSIQGGANYPFRRVASDIDVDLPSGTGDDAYLSALEGALGRACLVAGHADLVVFLAGADPWTGDNLGRLDVSKRGLAERDAMVVSTAEALGAALCVTLAGGYADDVRDTVEINASTVRTVAARATDVSPQVVPRRVSAWSSSSAR